jgi:ATP-dependent Clp protease ATP-binding subunit ClpA
MNVTLKPELMHVLEANKVQISEPREQMVQFNAVRVGPKFSKPATNVLQVQQSDDITWQVFVDEDLSYTGDDPARQRLFQGEPREGWKPVMSLRPLEGDVNLVILRVLEWLESPMRRVARHASRMAKRASMPTPPLDPQLERVGRFLSPKQLQASAVKLTARQAEVADRVAKVVTQEPSPACPVIHGPSGSGKTAVAVTTASWLIERGCVDQVFQVNGAAVASGAIFWPQRDDRLRHILQVLPSLERTLVIVEQFDFLLNNTEVTESLLSDCLDRGTKLIGVMRSDLTIYEVASAVSFLRRIQPVHLDEPEAHEVKTILSERLSQHPLADQIEIMPDVLPAVMMLAHLRPGANPGAAVGLLDALLAHVKWSDTKMATPDDVYYIVHPDRDCECPHDQPS